MKSEYPKEGRVGPVVVSVLLHVAIAALFGFGWWTFQRTPPPQSQQIAMDAVIVESDTFTPLTAATPDPEPEAAVEPEPAPELPPEPEPLPEPEPAPEPPPEPDADAQAREEEQRRVAAEALAAEEARRVEETRKAEAARKAEEARKVEEARKLEEARKARELEQRRKADAEARAAREAGLRRVMEAEERERAARASGAYASWVAQIRARIQGAWIRPPTARPGIDCTVYVSQVPGGEVVSVRIGECNGDDAVRQSIESAVYRASPLPPPPDPALFERNLEVNFKPNE